MTSYELPHRLLVVDIDGLRQDVFHEALYGKKVPALSRLLEGAEEPAGIHLDPVSTAPSITFCAQSSIFTGSQPEAHFIVGNQFFDRFGQRTGGRPRFYAFDVGDALAYEDAVLTFTQAPNLASGLLGQALNPQIKTLYEIAARQGKTSTVVYHMVSRGATHWIRPSLTDIARFTKGGGLVGMSAEQYDGEMISKALAFLRSGARPDVLTVYFMGLDHTSHQEGPGSQLDYLTRVVDPLLQQLVDELERLNLLEGTLVGVVSDHGQIGVIPDDRHSLRLSFPFDREMGYLFDALGLDVHDKPGEGPACDAVVASNGGLAHIYIRREAGSQRIGAWSDLPRFEQDVLTVARAFWEANADGKYAPDLQGALSAILVRDVEHQGWQADYQALTPEGSLTPAAQFLQAHPQIQTAEAAHRLRALACPTSGDLLLISNYAEGFYFGGITVGVHGGLHPEESLAVASLGWPGASTVQWARLRGTAENILADHRAADQRERASLADFLPIVVNAMGWDA